MIENQNRSTKDRANYGPLVSNIPRQELESTWDRRQTFPASWISRHRPCFNRDKSFVVHSVPAEAPRIMYPTAATSGC